MSIKTKVINKDKGYEQRQIVSRTKIESEVVNIIKEDLTRENCLIISNY